MRFSRGARAAAPPPRREGSHAVKPTYDVWTDPDLRAARARRARARRDRATRFGGASDSRRRSRRLRRRPARLLAAASALAAVVALALVAPWDRSAGSLGDVALAAIGSQPVLHVVAASPRSEELIDLGTGASRPVVQREEIWFDADRGLKRSLVTVGGTITDDTLETPEGGFTPGGIVYDCAWIAAHPVEATRARVSCNASGENGTTPHVVPRRSRPSSRDSRGSWTATGRRSPTGWRATGGSGELDGRPVDWLVFQTSRGSERVALDATTHRPLLLEDGTGWSLRIESDRDRPLRRRRLRPAAADELRRGRRTAVRATRRPSRSRPRRSPPRCRAPSGPASRLEGSHSHVPSGRR